MGIERLRVWQWCLIGLIVGGATATVYLWDLPAEPKNLKNGGPRQFEMYAWRRIEEGQHRRVARLYNVVIHPAMEFKARGEKTVYEEFATYTVDLVRTDDKLKADPVPCRLFMSQHYARAGSILGDENVAKMDVRQYLTRMQEKIEAASKLPNARVKPFTVKYRWIEAPKAAYTVGLGSGFIIIGLIWPTLLYFLSSAGFGRAAEDEYDLSRFKGSSKSKSAKAKAVAAEEADKLAQLEAELEAKLAADAKPRVTKEAVKVAEVPVRELKGAPLEPAPEVPQNEKAAKGFGADQGDYYPTEVHGKTKQ